MMALSAVNCRKIGDDWVLAIDVGEKCTLSDTSGGLFPLAVASIIIYPIGVPVIIYCLLWFQRVPHLAERKRNRWDNAPLNPKPQTLNPKPQTLKACLSSSTVFFGSSVVVIALCDVASIAQS
jgi:hypothetical protein